MRDRRRDPAGRRAARRRGRRPHHRGDAPPRPGRLGRARRGRDRARPPPSQDHRPVRARRPAHGRLRAGPGRGVQRLHLQLPRAARRAGGRRATGSSPTPTPRCCSRRSTAGARPAWSASSACSRSPSPSATPACSRSAATASGIKPLYLAETPGRIRFASALPALLDGRRRRHVDRPGRAAPLHDVPLRRPRAAHDPGGVRKLPPATVRTIRPDGSGDRARLLAPRARAPRAGPGHERARLARRGAGGAAGRGAPPHGRRRAGRGAALGRARLVAGRRPARRRGPDRAQDVQRRLPRRGGRERRRVRVLRPDRRALRHRPPADPRRPRPHAARRRRRHHRDGRADGQPRLRRVLPAVRGGREVGQGRAVRPGRRRGVRGLQLVPAAGRGAPLPRASRPTRGCSPTARTTTWRPSSNPSGCCPRPEPRVRRRALRRAGRRRHAGRRAAHRLDGHAGGRPGQARRQHDHGLGAGGARARSSTTSWWSWPPPARPSSSSRTAARACSRRPRAASCRTR